MTLYWRPRAENIAQYALYTPDGATRHLRVTVGGELIQGENSASLADAITTFVAAWNASVHPYFAEVTAVAAASTFTLTGDEDGVPFVAAVEEDDGTGAAWAALAATTTVAADGQGHWNNVINWITAAGAVSAAVPTTETVIFDTGSQGCVYGLPSAYDGGIVVTGDFTGSVGLQTASFCVDNTGSSFEDGYPEYRTQLGLSGGAAINYLFGGNPRYVSAEFNLVASDDPLITVNTQSMSASVGNQRDCVELRIMDETAGVAVTSSEIYVQDGGLEIINLEASNFDLRFVLYQTGGRVHYSDSDRTNTNRRVTTVYVNGGEFYGGIGAAMGSLFVYEGGFAELLDMMITTGIYVFGGTLDLSKVGYVSSVAGWVIQHQDGEIVSSGSTPPIVPTSYTIYPDKAKNFRCVFSPSFIPANIAMSNTGDQLRTLSFRRL